MDRAAGGQGGRAPPTTPLPLVTRRLNYIITNHYSEDGYCAILDLAPLHRIRLRGAPYFKLVHLPFQYTEVRSGEFKSLYCVE